MTSGPVVVGVSCKDAYSFSKPTRDRIVLRDGLLKEVAYRDTDGVFVRKAGIMGVVLQDGEIRPGDPIAVEPPQGPAVPLDRV